MNGFYETKMSR